MQQYQSYFKATQALVMKDEAALPSAFRWQGTVALGNATIQLSEFYADRGRNEEAHFFEQIRV